MIWRKKCLDFDGILTTKKEFDSLDWLYNFIISKIVIMSRKLILYIAMSLDGFIAKKDDSLDFLSMVEKPNEDYGYAEFTIK